MIVGVPKEVKNHEYRVAATPEGVRELVRAGHEVMVETTAGQGSAISDADFEVAQGIPAGAEELHRRLAASDAFIIASPEYNGSMPGNLKNVIDWTSRFRPQPFDGRHGLLLSASPSMVGGNRGLWALRVPLEHLGSRIFPDMFSLSMAHKAIVGDEIADPALRDRFEKTLVAFLSLAEAAANYACMKKSWVEFLGETPGAGVDRVDEPVDA